MDMQYVWLGYHTHYTTVTTAVATVHSGKLKKKKEK